MGFFLDTLHDGVKLFEKCRWIDLLVEQPHASDQGLMKVHVQYGEDIVMCRSMLMQGRVFFNLDANVRKHRCRIAFICFSDFRRRD